MNLSEQAIQKALNHQWQEAIDLNQKILESTPDDTDALNRLAMAYTHLDSIEKAKKIYYQVIAIDKLNQIAQRNLQRLNNLNGTHAPVVNTKIFNFIEEPGKTKIISLVRIAEKCVLSEIQPCTPLEFNIKQKNICFSFNNKYVGRLPDDISRRLIWLYKRNNRYSVFVKTITDSKVTVFIKETKRSYQNKNYCSFTPQD